jgi:hypothetical protein
MTVNGRAGRRQVAGRSGQDHRRPHGCPGNPPPPRYYRRRLPSPTFLSGIRSGIRRATSRGHVDVGVRVQLTHRAVTAPTAAASTFSSFFVEAAQGFSGDLGEGLVAAERGQSETEPSPVGITLRHRLIGALAVGVRRRRLPSGPAVGLDRLQRGGGGPVDDSAVRVEPGAVAGAVPAAFRLVEVDRAPQMRTVWRGRRRRSRRHSAARECAPRHRSLPGCR